MYKKISSATIYKVNYSYLHLITHLPNTTDIYLLINLHKYVNTTKDSNNLIIPLKNDIVINSSIIIAKPL